ncbi:DNA-3-methyladenine glycosylase [Aestuariibius sp. HNIBRBA575]|uniref:DNA-3-methyladenine glycosylase family protein n=1 Tax=Aestuariibius sp. HNIBRBA575 TaxID=3233343 RepID=UPI0034A4CC73
MNESVIVSPDCIEKAAHELVQVEPKFLQPYQLLAPLPLRLKPQGFASLLQAIMGQQVSVASANAIWDRLIKSGLTDEAEMRKADEDNLRNCGLSRQKIKYAKALADAQLDYAAFPNQESRDVIKTLTSVTGIGTWTAEIYAKFSLGRADIFAAGDLALQEGAKMLFALPERPNEKQMRHMATAWSPYRSVAARLLWAYYKHQKQREGIT